MLYDSYYLVFISRVQLENQIRTERLKDRLRMRILVSTVLTLCYSSLALVSAQCQEGVDCPPPDSPPTNLPDPGDCSSYFLCVGGCAIHQKVWPLTL